MYFMNGVILIKEVVVTSLVGNILLAVILIALMAMVGLVLSCFLLILMRSDGIIPIFNSFGLTERTGKYEVTVTADTDMNEFQERYEIINYENGVYTIKVK